MNIPRPILQTILSGYQLYPYGTHGVTHWARVLENGRALVARTPGASLVVVELFAVFHDACRKNEGHDPDHGRRGADLARALRGQLADLDDDAFSLLYQACAQHTDGRTRADVSVQVCWDADRLDLNRVGITPLPALLCTSAARDLALRNWANTRAQNRFAPALVRDEWALDDVL